jgi:hypothetical protein
VRESARREREREREREIEREVSQHLHTTFVGRLRPQQIARLQKFSKLSSDRLDAAEEEAWSARVDEGLALLLVHVYHCSHALHYL